MACCRIQNETPISGGVHLPNGYALPGTALSMWIPIRHYGNAGLHRYICTLHLALAGPDCGCRAHTDQSKFHQATLVPSNPGWSKSV
jgi:hypothetical protein